jgi:homoserine kinase
VSKRWLGLAAPATSANVGPGFDTAALGLGLHLHVDAQEAEEFGIEASGRNADICGALENNLILAVYREVLERAGVVVTPLHLQLRNEIPLGMGCGSSAAARVAGVTLAVYFGQLGWSRERIFEEVARLEGHPDNAAACVFGGFVVSGAKNGAGEGGPAVAVMMTPPEGWSAVLAIPAQPLATSESRAVLPEQYARRDAVSTVQCVALLTAGFARADETLVRAGMHDWLHEPYRAEVCPLLPALRELRSEPGVLGVALSGAGPSVLVLCRSDAAEAIRAKTIALTAARADVGETVVMVSPLDAKGLQVTGNGMPLW